MAESAKSDEIEWSIFDTPASPDTENPIESTAQDSDSLFELAVPILGNNYSTNYAKCLSEIITNSIEDNDDSVSESRNSNISFEMLPGLYKKEKVKKEIENYEIFPSLHATEVDESNDDWCEEAKFKEYYDNFTRNIEYPKYKDTSNDDILMDAPLRELLKDLQYLREPYRRSDSNSELTESHFKAQMEWKLEWDASNSDEERELEKKEMLGNCYDDEEELWPTTENIDDGKNLICYYCNYSTSKQRYLNFHINTKHIERQYSCCRCDYTTTNRDSLQGHIENVHVHKCQLCDFKTLRKDELKDHMIKVHWTREFWECSKCNYITSKKHKLKHHIKVAHPRINDEENGAVQYNELQCYSCPYSSSTKKDLAFHLKTAHLQQRIDRCADCGYRPKNWKDHQEHDEKCDKKNNS